MRKAFSAEKVSSLHNKKQTVIISKANLAGQQLKTVIENMGYPRIFGCREALCEKKLAWLFEKIAFGKPKETCENPKGIWQLPNVLGVLVSYHNRCLKNILPAQFFYIKNVFNIMAYCINSRNGCHAIC